MTNTNTNEEKTTFSATANLEEPAVSEVVSMTDNKPVGFKDVADPWNTPLKQLEAWDIARKNLKKWLDENETQTLGEFFSSKAQRSAPFSYQNLAIMCHTSSGYIGDKWKKAKEDALKAALDNKTQYNEQATIVQVILDNLAPNLAEERAKRAAKRAEIIGAWNGHVNAVLAAVSSILETWQEFDIPCNLASVRKIVSKYKDKDNGLNIIATLAETNLNADEIITLSSELGLNLEDYWLDESSLNNPPASMFENV